MNVPVTVVRGEAPISAADAFLLPGGDVHRLGGIIASLAEGAPQVYRIRGAWLIVPPTARGSEPSGLILLRRVAVNYFFPVDGELSPAILPDEFAGLTRGGGLVHLPSGCFAFDPSSPVPISDWLRLPPRGRGSWEPFPVLPASPDTLRLIERPSPPAAIIEVLGGGEPEGYDPVPSSGAVAEEARPPSAPMLLKVAGGAALGAAGAMAWLGQKLGLGGLARMGAGLAKRAVDAVPRLSEKILGQQEAALRELLRQLQSGNAEEALKRAPIAVADPDRPGTVAGDATLSERSILYSFAELFRGGGGAASAWVGGGDVWSGLQREYRRLAEEAAKRGDYRRAAYLLGVLLRDLRGAANVLKTGGRYRDAALLLRDRLNDPTGAAAAFELAGDFDEAVRLYESTGQDVMAGDLLRRIGDETRAESSYRLAAGKLAQHSEHLTAGDLILSKLGNRQVALGYFRSGWDARRSDALACGERLIDDALVEPESPKLDLLLAEGTVRFAPPAHAEAGRFFNYVLRKAPLFPADRGADIRDRVRLFFAEHLRIGDRGKVSARIDPLFGERHGGWTASVRRDAAYATATGAVVDPAPAIPKLRIDGAVRAVAHAADGGVVFIGTDHAVTAWNLATDQSANVAHSWKGELVALCTDRKGTALYTLVDHASYLRLTAYAIDPAKGRKAEALASVDVPYEADDHYLQPHCFDDVGANFIVLAADGVRKGYHAQMLLAGSAGPYPEEFGTVHWIGQACGLLWDWSDGKMIGYHRLDARGGPRSWAVAHSGSLGWTPAAYGNRPLLDCGTLDDATLVVAGVATDGTVHRNEVQISGANVEPRHVSTFHPDGYTAVALLRANCIAVANGKNQIHILRAVAGRLTPAGAPVQLGTRADVVFLGKHGPELVAVLADGTTVRIPVPTRG